MGRLIAVVENGVWTTIEVHTPPPVSQPSPASQNNDSYVVDTRSDIERIAAHLGQAVRLAQTLSPTDARRARDLMHAAQGAMSASTYLEKPEQALFNKSLRGEIE